MGRRPSSSRSAGFTLLELSIVIAIIATVAGVSASMGSSMVEAAKRVSTNNKLDAIETALMAFRLGNNRLPCPAIPQYTESNASFGHEAPDPGTCVDGSVPNNASVSTNIGIVAEGAVPVRTLSLPDEFQVDGWGRKFSYAVWAPLTGLNAFVTYGLQPMCGVITIKNAGGGSRSAAGAYALISYGPNGHGGYLKSGTRYFMGSDNADEWTNCHCNATVDTGYTATYIQKDPTQANSADSLSVFDDIVRYKERWQMQDAYDGYNPSGFPCVPGFIINGINASPGDQAGYSLAMADISGHNNGTLDLIIGAPHANGGTGAVYVVFGSKTGFPDPLPLSSLNGSNGFELDGVNPGDNTGWAVAAGDVNGDGKADIIIGAPNVTAGGNANAGRVYVVYGGATAAKDGTAWTSCPCPLNPNFLNGNGGNGVAVNGYALDGAAAGANAGYAVASADVNSDSKADIIIGAPGAAVNGANSGAVYVVYGAALSPVVRIVDNADSTGFSESGGGWTNNPGYGYRNSMDAAGPAGNGSNTATWTFTGLESGTYDVAATWNDHSNHATNAPYTVYDNASSLGTVTVDQRPAPTDITYDSWGWKDLGNTYAITSGTLKVTLNDNANNYVIADAVYIRPLSASVALNSGFLTGVTGRGYELDGTAGVKAGYALATGDVNGDGKPDILIGAPGAAPNGANSGAVYVVYCGASCSVLAPLFSDTLGGSSLGAAWTTHTGTWAEGGGYLRATSSYDAALTDRTYPADVQITAEVRVDSWGAEGQDQRCGVGLYLEPVHGWGYGFVFHQNHTTLQFLDEIHTWGNSYAFTRWSEGTWYWFKFKMQGGVLYGKVWQDGNSEPATWPYSQPTDPVNGTRWTDYASSGGPGLNATEAVGTVCSFKNVTVINPDVSANTVGPFTLNSTFLNAINGVEYDGAAGGDAVGSSLATGDVNGDNTTDMIIGAPGAGGGAVYTVFGKSGGWSAMPTALNGGVLDGNQGFELDGTGGSNAGSSLASADVNGDGIPDLIIGAPGANAAYVVFGQASGWAAATNLDGGLLNGTTGSEFDGPGGSNTGFSVTAGDISGDNIPDVIIGAYNTSAGSSYVYYGRKTSWPATPYSLGGL